MIESRYFQIYINNDDKTVNIIHNILDEYHMYEDDMNTFDDFRKYVVNAYKKSEELDLCTIINIDDTKIEIQIPKYKVLYDVMNTKNSGPGDVDSPFIMNDHKLTIKFTHILEKMWENRIIHMNLSFRNIGINDSGNFQLIDVSDIRQCDNLDEFIKWFSSSDIKDDFDDFNNLPVYDNLLLMIKDFENVANYTMK